MAIKTETPDYRINGKTGETCKVAGLYKCEQHLETFVGLTEGAKFPQCTADIFDSHDTTWILITNS